MTETTMDAARPRLRARSMRPAALVTALVGVALVVAACGGGSATPGVANLGSRTPTTTAAANASQGGPGSADYTQSLAFAECMRARGEPGFRDPNSQGAFLITRNSHVHLPPQGSAVDVAANKACRHLLPNGGKMTPAELQSAMAAMLRYSQCMRTHGVPNFPDPVEQQGGISLSIGSTGLGPNSPQLQATQRACRSLAPGGGP